MNDNTVLTFGLHKDKHLRDVPAKYLLHLYDSGKAYGSLLTYIKDNLDVLKKEQFKSKR